MDSSPYLIMSLLQAFEWFDEGLQQSLRQNRLPHLTRPESMVMMHVQLGIIRPTDIARSLRLTRQAIHSTIARLVDQGLFVLVDDPTDGRMNVVELTDKGRALREDARLIVDALTEHLMQRIGSEKINALKTSLAADWGEPPAYEIPRESAFAKLSTRDGKGRLARTRKRKRDASPQARKVRG